MACIDFSVIISILKHTCKLTMNYLQFIANALMEVHVFEMAFQRKHVINKTRDLSLHIAQHVCKIALYPEHSARKHWEKEIHASCDSIDDLKFDGNKKLKSSDYHNLLYKEPYEHTGLLDNTARKSIGSGMVDHKWTEEHKSIMSDKIRTVYDKLSTQLANTQYVHINSILKDSGI